MADAIAALSDILKKSGVAVAAKITTSVLQKCQLGRRAFGSQGYHITFLRKSWTLNPKYSLLRKMALPLFVTLLSAEPEI